MYFVILLSIFTAILTVWDNLIIAAIFFLIILIIGLLQKKINRSKQLMILGLSFIISISSVRFRQSLYQPNIDQNKIFGIVKIINIQDGNTYVVDYQNQNFFLETDEKFQLGDSLLLEGNISSGYTGHIFDMHSQRQNLTQISAYKFSYTKRLVTKNIKGTIYPTTILLQDQNKIGLISQVKSNLQSRVLSSYGQNRVSGLILGMLIGDKSILPTVDYENFRDSGLVHIIAVSGGNIVMIVVFLSFILFFLPFYFRVFVILITIIFYSLICGLDSSVLRATIMGGLGLLALLVGRNIDKRRILAIAYISMLVYNPYYLAYDIGFLFSFSAVVGIIVIEEYRRGIQSRFAGFASIMITEEKKENVVIPPNELNTLRGDILLSLPKSMQKARQFQCFKNTLRQAENTKQLRSHKWAPTQLFKSRFFITMVSIFSHTGNCLIHKLSLIFPVDFTQKISKLNKFLRKHISVYLIPSLGATIGIFPFMMFFVGKINLISIFGNLLILPIIPFVMIYGFVSVFLFSRTGRYFILSIEQFLVNYIFLISDLTAKWGIYLNIEADWLKYGLVIIFVIWLRRKAGKLWKEER